MNKYTLCVFWLISQSIISCNWYDKANNCVSTYKFHWKNTSWTLSLLPHKSPTKFRQGEVLDFISPCQIVLGKEIVDLCLDDLTHLLILTNRRYFPVPLTQTCNVTLCDGQNFLFTSLSVAEILKQNSQDAQTEESKPTNEGVNSVTQPTL